MRRSLVIGVSVLAMAIVVLGTLSVVAPLHEPPTAAPVDEEPTYVTVDGTNSTFWPYLSPAERYQRRSPVNVVIVGGDLDRVIDLLESQAYSEVETGDADSDSFSAREVQNATAIDWGGTTGADRYASVDDGSGPEWVAQQAHLQDGTYYGSRTHLRLYELPDGNGVVIQAHAEHFDWFTLRHAVDGVDGAQRSVEAEFMDRSFTDRLWRLHLGNDGPSDSDGWATVVELGVLLPAIGLLSVLGSGATGRIRDWLRRHTTARDRHTVIERYRSLTWRHVALGASTIVVYLGVRLAGVLLETWTSLSMHAIAALLYPFLAVGLPVATYLVADGIDSRMDAAMIASGALAAAIVLDYAALGVSTLPIDIVIHRVGLLVSIGLIAGGAANRATEHGRSNDLEVVGVVGWVLLLVATLSGTL